MVLYHDPYEIIINSRRRKIIKYLRSLGGEAHIKEISRRIAKSETDDEASSQLIKSIYISILQNHIPVMERAGLISYDEVNGIIKLNNLPKNLKFLIEVVEKGDISWAQYYLLLGVASLTASILIRNIMSQIISVFFIITAIINMLVIHYELPIKKAQK